MRKLVLKLVSLSLVLAMVFACVVVAASAITWDNVPETKYASGYWSDYYTWGQYYKNMTEMPLTGDGARDAVAIAMTQVNYLEGDSTYDQHGLTAGSGNYTEYGSYTNVNASAWCASFCSWVLYTAGCTTTRGTETYMARNGYYWSECYVPHWSIMLNNNGRYQYSYYYGGNYQPQPGDLVFFTYYYTPLDEDHIGMVVYADSQYVYTIEGNTSSQSGIVSEGGGVFFKRYDLWSSGIAGYGRLPYNTVSDLPAIDYSGANPTNGIYINPLGAISVYKNINDSYGSWTLPVSHLFEVTDVKTNNAGNVMLYVKCEIGTDIVYGWVKNDGNFNSSGRTLQLYASPDVKPSISTDDFTMENGMITGVSTETTVSSLLSSIDMKGEGGTIKVYNSEGTLCSGSDLVGTNSVVELVYEGEVIDSYEVVIMGDVTCDGKMNSLDYVVLRRHVMNLNYLEGNTFTAGDLDPDGKLLFFDYVALKRAVLGTMLVK